jgi:hypothetical protein
MRKLICKLFGHWFEYGVALSDKDIATLNVETARCWGDYYWNKCRICGQLDGHSYN